MFWEIRLTDVERGRTTDRKPLPRDRSYGDILVRVALDSIQFLPKFPWTLLGLVVFLCGCGPEPASTSRSTSGSRISQELATQVEKLEARERQINGTVWAKEWLAQKYGRVFEDLWDSLNASTNKLPVLGSFPVGSVRLGNWGAGTEHPHAIQTRDSTGPGIRLSNADWKHFLQGFSDEKWELTQTEFRHTEFEVEQGNFPAKSRFYFCGNLVNTHRQERVTVEGDLIVTWRGGSTNEVVEEIDASHLTIRSRRGQPPFELIFEERVQPGRNSRSVDPLLLYDLDGDGLSEIVLAAKNVVYQRASNGAYVSRPLCRHSPGAVYAALIADFDGDGYADFLVEDFLGLKLFRGTPQGTFDEPARLVWRASPEVQYPMALTAGDIDHDGDLDLFLAQYKLPYDGGQMPTPYYDANDGFPAFMLANDGRGNFFDVTAAAGLEKKRWRRSFSASLVDLNGDTHLDLVVASDFAGLDLYTNDGRGQFRDVTAQRLPERHGFGMAQVTTDFDADGSLDLLMIGMPSPTADRLDGQKLWHPEDHSERTMRGRMSAGNRLFFGEPGGAFRETPANRSLARAGWAWGCSADDLDNDGYPDVYIANGMESRESVREYEGEFWLHDIFVADSTENAAANLYLLGKVTRSRGRGESHGGHERNRLYVNQRGASFLEAAHLFGVALELDSRCVVTDDLDGDGRLDLVLVSFEPWPGVRPILQVYRNTLPDPGHWIGFRFSGTSATQPLEGAQVVVEYDGHKAIRSVVAGDSYRVQHPPTVHFGVGAENSVDRVMIRFPNGRTIEKRQLPADHCYRVTLRNEIVLETPNPPGAAKDSGTSAGAYR